MSVSGENRWPPLGRNRWPLTRRMLEPVLSPGRHVNVAAGGLAVAGCCTTTSVISGTVLRTQVSEICSTFSDVTCRINSTLISQSAGVCRRFGHKTRCCAQADDAGGNAERAREVADRVGRARAVKGTATRRPSAGPVGLPIDCAPRARTTRIHLPGQG